MQPSQNHAGHSNIPKDVKLKSAKQIKITA